MKLRRRRRLLAFLAPLAFGLEASTTIVGDVTLHGPCLRNSDVGVTAGQIESSNHPWILHEGKAGASVIAVPKP